MTEAIDAILENCEALGIFVFVIGAIFFCLVAAGMAVVIFAGLALRASWRALRRASWNSVVVSLERKALRSR